MILRFLIISLCLSTTPLFADSFLKKADEGSTKFFDRLKEEDKRAAEAAQRRDKSKDVCYQFKSGSDLQTACLGEYPYSVKSERARNLLLGNCYSMGSSSELSNDLSYTCERGVSGCATFDDGDAAYWCTQCNASTQWLAVYSYGRIIQCYK